MNRKACLCLLVGFFSYIYFKINIMDLSRQVKQFQDAEDSAILSGMPLYAGPEFNVTDYIEKEDKARGLGDFAKEKREKSYEKEKEQIDGLFDGLKKASELAERRNRRLEAMKLAVQAGYTDLGNMSRAAETIYQFIIKPQ